MKTIHNGLWAAMLAGALALAAPQQASAELRIDLVFIVVDNTPPPKPPLIAGGGDLQEIMKVAAEKWERVFKNGSGQWNLTIEYGWGPIASNLFGQERMQRQAGNPVRITHSRILFNNVPPVEPGTLGFFADPTPRDNSKYLRYTSDRADVEGGVLNVGRVFSEATGHAEERIDLLTIAMHEIGHALGLDGDYMGFLGQFYDGLFVDVTKPRPFPGFRFTIGQGPHIDGFELKPLMVGTPRPGVRQFISGADALLIAQLSSFSRPSLAEPAFDAEDEDQGDY